MRAAVPPVAWQGAAQACFRGGFDEEGVAILKDMLHLVVQASDGVAGASIHSTASLVLSLALQCPPLHSSAPDVLILTFPRNNNRRCGSSASGRSEMDSSLRFALSQVGPRIRRDRSRS